MLKLIKFVPKTWQDKTFYDCEVEDNGQGVTASWWPAAGTVVTVGMEIDGTVGQNKKGYPTIVENKKAGGFQRSPSAINAAMEKKNESIRGFQATKETSIALAGLQRDMVLLATSLATPTTTREQLAEEVLYWKNWLMNNRPTEDELTTVDINKQF